MIDFDCLNRPRLNKISAVIEEFASNMCQFVEQELGRPLPDFRTYGLNRALPFHKTMTSIHKRDSRFLCCAINGCGKKHPLKLWLFVAGDLYSDRLCLFHFSQSQAFLFRGACVDCGLQRSEHPIASFWRVTRCVPCDYKQRNSDPEWLARPPCSVCSMTRDKSPNTGSWDTVCVNCRNYAAATGKDRSEGLEKRRQGIEKH